MRQSKPARRSERLSHKAGEAPSDRERVSIIHLTEAGEKLAREAMHETVRRGKSYHELVGQPNEDEVEESCGQRRRLSRNQAQRWLEKERADEMHQESPLLLYLSALFSVHSLRVQPL